MRPGVGMPFQFKGRCLSCNDIMLYEPPDKIPWCEKCRDKRKKEFARRRPDMAKKGEIEVFSEVIKPEKEE